MRISYVFDQHLPNDGADTEQMVNMVSALGAAGADVEVVLPGVRGVPPATVEGVCAHFKVAPTFRLRTVGALFPAPRALEKPGHGLRAALARAVRGAEVVYTRNIPTLLAVRASLGPPTVYETYRPWPRQLAALRVLFRGLARADRRTRMVLHSALARDAYLEAGFAPERLLVAYNGWDPAKMEPRLSREQARARCDLPGDAPIVLYAGRVTPQKGLLGVLELARRLPQARFVLVGSTGEGPVEAQARALSNVIVRPWAPFAELPAHLYAADILLIPPTVGPLQRVGNTVLPIKTFQYMASGRPIFGPAAPDVGELLRDGDNALLVRPDDPAAAEAGLARLLADPDLRERLGARAREDALELTWDHRARRVLTFLSDLAA